MIASAADILRSTVSDYLARVQARGMNWPRVAAMLQDELELLLFPPVASAHGDKMLPHLREIHLELRNKHVTLQLLWEEYTAAHPLRYRHRQFCGLYRRFFATLEVRMPHTHAPGKNIFVDYSGTRLPVVYPNTGDVRWAELSLRASVASNYTFAETTWTKQ